MPQLNPGPWYLTMVAAWTIILLSTPTLMKIKTPHQPKLTKNGAQKPTWTWPWS
uniref:ATP synthase complex subunit 8 n=1 Tax=Coleonyx variegatus TaxID=52435 RepID=A1IGD3_COLVA|nr:ATP synthase F0 subunit 8 [Coleonyx variegatus]BAF43970.1 ATPase subunit 8 [Coleonyx variegatus]